MPVRPGISVLLEDGGHDLRRARIGLIMHPASVTPTLSTSDDALRRAGFTIASLFGPQHGARGEKQENMVESASFVDPRFGIPVHSLYGDERKPTPAMLDGLDALVLDLQDVGVRVYTFVWTMTLAMEACRDAGIRFVVLDRPNPLGGVVREGPLLREGFESFVGLHPVPLRHGLTTGELARLANDAFGIGCDLDVVPCQGWERTAWFDRTGLPYVLPSPNLPTLDSCVAYPGMVLLEGTNLSEGRGTTRPFEFVGAPFLDAHAFASALEERRLPGVTFRACHFEPTFHKHANVSCGGAQLHIIDRDAFRSVETAVTVLRTAKDLAPDAFVWRSPPYEYEAEKTPIDILWGSEALRIGIDGGATVAEIMAGVGEEIARFEATAAPYLLY
ncbi:MAG: DUF1343 domain-containing protein [Gemmatimonadetes bacterium]|nr:DUF1343 domain-containing protein [Gemmatimonadota bacterium]